MSKISGSEVVCALHLMREKHYRKHNKRLSFRDIERLSILLLQKLRATNKHIRATSVSKSVANAIFQPGAECPATWDVPLVLATIFEADEATIRELNEMWHRERQRSETPTAQIQVDFEEALSVFRIDVADLIHRRSIVDADKRLIRLVRSCTQSVGPGHPATFEFQAMRGYIGVLRWNFRHALKCFFVAEKLSGIAGASCSIRDRHDLAYIQSMAYVAVGDLDRGARYVADYIANWVDAPDVIRRPLEEVGNRISDGYSAAKWVIREPFKFEDTHSYEQFGGGPFCARGRVFLGASTDHIHAVNEAKLRALLFASRKLLGPDHELSAIISADLARFTNGASLEGFSQFPIEISAQRGIEGHGIACADFTRVSFSDWLEAIDRIVINCELDAAIDRLSRYLAWLELHGCAESSPFLKAGTKLVSIYSATGQNMAAAALDEKLRKIREVLISKWSIQHD